ncbi:MAG: RNA 2',3'-cyclic phosphodiesterase [Candidatus Pacearchaeota archaeon]
MRCFIAIDLPKEVKKEISEIQTKLPEGKLLFVKPEIAHLTIKFLGEVDDYKLNRIKEILKKLHFKKFKAKLSNIGVFTPHFIKVVWVKLEPEKEFEEIHNLIDNSLSLENFKKDKKWESHVTLARVKHIKNKNEFIKKLNEIKVKPIEFNVDNITLKKSILTPEGPIYEDIFSISLLNN